MHRYLNVSADINRCFLKAAQYPRALAQEAALREPSARQRFPWSERHLQCVWFDPRLRPERLPMTGGEWLVVENPGVWNLEEGPDFLGAVMRIEPERRRVVGDVEIHVYPGDWQLHGHDRDPRYAKVRVHVTYFPGAGGPASIPHVALAGVLSQRPEWDLECVDVTAYPYAARGAVPPCAARLAEWNADPIGALLDAAGEERMRRKAERLLGQIEQRGSEQVFYGEVLTALGYKHNKAAFRRLAEAVPIHVLMDQSRGCPRRAYALLAGVAGLLPAEDHARWDEETRTWVRLLWDDWWRLRESFEGALMPRTVWRLGGIRPINHPARRLMAAALFFTATPEAAAHWRRVAEQRPRQTCALFVQRWLELRDEYFQRRCTLGGRPLKRPAGLVGKDRAEAIAINVLTPFLAAVGAENAFARGLLEGLPPAEENSIIRQTAHTLLGPDHPPSLYRSGLRRQGLLQIFHDYCLNDRSRCATCLLPSLLRSDP
jgi:hypothetical protein